MGHATLIPSLTTARPLARLSFTAWRQTYEGKEALPHELFASSLPAIEREIATPPMYGATVFVLETDAVTDARTLHVYRIRRGKWLGRMDRETGNKVYPHSADLLFRIPVTAFDPVQPWRWSPGADVVGGDAGLIEGRAA